MRNSPDVCTVCGFIEAEHRIDGLTTCVTFERKLRPRVHLPTEDSTQQAGRGRFTFDPAEDHIVLEVPGTDWTVAYRLVFQAGTPVVAEVRVYPTGPPGEGRPGQWIGDAGAVPGGGLTARRRRRVGITEHRFHVDEIMEVVQAAMGADSFDAFMALQGLSHEVLTYLKGGWEPSSDRTTRLAQVAGLYVAALQAGATSPVAEVAERLDIPRTSVRDQLNAARKLDLLGRPAVGVAGGTLTSKARRILEDEMKGME